MSPGKVSRATCRPGNPSTVANICLTETVWAPRCRPVKSPGKVSPSSFSARPMGNLSPATSRPGYPGFVAGENGKYCSEWIAFLPEQLLGPESHDVLLPLNFADLLQSFSWSLLKLP
ncbi:hypothetical protein Tco_1394973 [Tanacetum coccineum]